MDGLRGDVTRQGANLTGLREATGSERESAVKCRPTRADTCSIW